MKASQEAARLVGSENVNIVTDARKHRDGKFGLVPDPTTWSATADESDCVVTYYCDNETVDGVEFQAPPTGHNLIADMSSNFLSRPVDVRKHAAIFGGAQKNVGSTGITIAIVSNRILPPHAEMADPKLLRRLGMPIGPVVLDKKYTLASVSQSAGQLFEHLLLRQSNLLCAVLIPVGTHFTLLSRIEDNRKARRLQWLE